MERPLHDAEHVGLDAVDVDVVAEAGGQRLDRQRRVVAGPVEAAVDRRWARRRSGPKRPRTSSVEAATASDSPWANEPRSALRPIAVPAKTAASTPVTSA